jgi:hypothetical protein
MPFIESGTTLPTDQTQLWRYMEFTKFMDLIMNSHIYLAPVMSFLQDDPWEVLGCRPNETSRCIYNETSGKADLTRSWT